MRSRLRLRGRRLRNDAIKPYKFDGGSVIKPGLIEEKRYKEALNLLINTVSSIPKGKNVWVTRG